ncbi:hypothetical protein QJQ45_023031 [Haematococcus lacustris]|nr:hypothetical protein QJQ45_023031 [Haematococcus lacustris]
MNAAFPGARIGVGSANAERGPVTQRVADINYASAAEAGQALRRNRFKLKVANHDVDITYQIERKDVVEKLAGEWGCRFMVVVKNLPPGEVSCAELSEMFEAAGEIFTIKVLPGNRGEPYALVQYVEEQSVEASINQINQQKLHGAVLYVERHLKARRQAGTQQGSNGAHPPSHHHSQGANGALSLPASPMPAHAPSPAASPAHRPSAAATVAGVVSSTAASHPSTPSRHTAAAASNDSSSAMGSSSQATTGAKHSASAAGVAASQTAPGTPSAAAGTALPVASPATSQLPRKQPPPPSSPAHAPQRTPTRPTSLFTQPASSTAAQGGAVTAATPVGLGGQGSSQQAAVSATTSEPGSGSTTPTASAPASRQEGAAAGTRPTATPPAPPGNSSSSSSQGRGSEAAGGPVPALKGPQLDDLSQIGPAGTQPSQSAPAAAQSGSSSGGCSEAAEAAHQASPASTAPATLSASQAGSELAGLFAPPSSSGSSSMSMLAQDKLAAGGGLQPSAALVHTLQVPVLLSPSATESQRGWALTQPGPASTGPKPLGHSAVPGLASSQPPGSLLLGHALAGGVSSSLGLSNGPPHTSPLLAPVLDLFSHLRAGGSMEGNVGAGLPAMSAIGGRQGGEGASHMGSLGSSLGSDLTTSLMSSASGNGGGPGGALSAGLTTRVTSSANGAPSSRPLTLGQASQPPTPPYSGMFQRASLAAPSLGSSQSGPGPGNGDSSHAAAANGHGGLAPDMSPARGLGGVVVGPPPALGQPGGVFTPSGVNNQTYLQQQQQQHSLHLATSLQQQQQQQQPYTSPLNQPLGYSQQGSSLAGERGSILGLPTQHQVSTAATQQQQQQQQAAVVAAAAGLGLGRISIKDALRLALGRLEEMVTCPLTMEMMREPVVAADGYTYERAAIQNWLGHSDTSPVTSEQLTHKLLLPNKLARDIIQDILP